jgi:ribosomal protein L2
MKIGMLILTKDTKFLNIGYTTLIKNIKSGMLINSIELELNQGSKYIRSAGIFSKALTSINTSHLIKLKSKEIILINKNCLVTFGILISNNIFKKKFKKASFFRYKG